jgi:hypothetical protein
MKLIYKMTTSLFVGNHLRTNHQSALVSSRLLHIYLHLQPLRMFLLLGGGAGSTIRSTAEARDFAQLLADYLEGLKDTEADRAGTHSSFSTSSLRFFVLTLQ